MTSLAVLSNCKKDNYNSSLMIINYLIINATNLAKVIINIVVIHHGLVDSIVSDQ